MQVAPGGWGVEVGSFWATLHLFPCGDRARDGEGAEELPVRPGKPVSRAGARTAAWGGCGADSPAAWLLPACSGAGLGGQAALGVTVAPGRDLEPCSGPAAPGRGGWGDTGGWTGLRARPLPRLHSVRSSVQVAAGSEGAVVSLPIPADIGATSLWTRRGLLCSQGRAWGMQHIAGRGVRMGFPVVGRLMLLPAIPTTTCSCRGTDPSTPTLLGRAFVGIRPARQVCAGVEHIGLGWQDIAPAHRQVHGGVCRAGWRRHEYSCQTPAPWAQPRTRSETCCRQG